MGNKQALVVDDSRVARLTLNKILMGHGLSVVEQDSAESAMQWLQQQTELPDVIFMDLMMPGMDGMTATRTIKSDVRWQGIPVVVCTGNDSELDKSKAAESGAIAVLAKPPAADSVNQILSQLPEKPSPSPASPESHPLPAAIDENALLTKLQQQLEQHWLPKLHAELLQQLSVKNQQSDERAARQQVDQIQAMKLSLLPELKQQMQNSIETALNELRQQTENDNTVLQQQMTSMLEQAFKGFDVIGKWQSRLQEEASGWLHQQKMNTQESLQQNLSPIIDAKIQQQLSTELTKQLKTVLAQQSAEVTAQIKRERAELETVQKRNITLAWAAMGVALAALIISVL